MKRRKNAESGVVIIEEPAGKPVGNSAAVVKSANDNATRDARGTAGDLAGEKATRDKNRKWKILLGVFGAVIVGLVVAIVVVNLPRRKSSEETKEQVLTDTAECLGDNENVNNVISCLNDSLDKVAEEDDLNEKTAEEVLADRAARIVAAYDEVIYGYLEAGNENAAAYAIVGKASELTNVNACEMAEGAINNELVEGMTATNRIVLYSMTQSLGRGGCISDEMRKSWEDKLITAQLELTAEMAGEVIE